MPPVSKSDGAKYDIDRVPFYGSKLPTNVAALKATLQKVSRPTFQKIIRVAVSSIEGKPVQHDMLKNLTTSTIPLDIIHKVYAGVAKLLQCAFRCSATSLTQEQFLEDLGALNIAKEMRDDLVSAVFGSRRTVLENAVIQQKPRLPSVGNFKWKIDVGISTTSLSRVLEPVIAVELTLSNGEIKQFEMSVSKFQELRYNVAYVLKEMEDIEKKSILKIQD